jgi:hypothetical protein
MATTLENKISILVEVLQNEEPKWNEFINFNNLGLPYAYGVQRGFFPAGDDVTRLIEKTFGVLLQVLSIDEDRGFETLEEMEAASAG